MTVRDHLRTMVGLKPKDAIDDPEVQKQLRERQPHKPYVLLLVTLAQIVMMAVSIIVNNGIEPMNLNYMAGPSTLTLLQLGAKYAPCMRQEPWKANVTSVPCPSGYTGTPGANNTCAYYDALAYTCGMGGWLGGSTPDQYWRFITPVFLHTGLIHLATTMIFQVRFLPLARVFNVGRFGLCGVLLVFLTAWFSNFNWLSDLSVT